MLAHAIEFIGTGKIFTIMTYRKKLMSMMAYLLNLLEFGAKDLISNLDGMSTFLVIFSRLENRFK